MMAVALDAEPSTIPKTREATHDDVAIPMRAVPQKPNSRVRQALQVGASFCTAWRSYLGCPMPCTLWLKYFGKGYHVKRPRQATHDAACLKQ